MSKQADKYGLLKQATDLIVSKMDINTTNNWAKGTCDEVALERTYKEVEAELLSYIGKQVNQIKTLTELTDAFVDSCYALGAVGVRLSRLQAKLCGETKTGAEALQEAITKDTVDDAPDAPVWGGGLPIVTWDRASLSVENLCDEAFSTYIWDYNTGNNIRALSFVYLLYYMSETSQGYSLNTAIQDLRQSTCLKVITTGEKWKKHSLVGYLSEDGNYSSASVNKGFTSIFGEKLKSLLEKSKDNFEALQLKQALHEQLIRTYAESCSPTPIEVYVEIEKLMAASKTTKGITAEDVENATYSNKFAVVKRYDATGLTYELNFSGLQTLAELLGGLGLDGLQEVNSYIGKVKSFCA